jgi:hypothetical protein
MSDESELIKPIDIPEDWKNESATSKNVTEISELEQGDNPLLTPAYHIHLEGNQDHFISSFPRRKLEAGASQSNHVEKNR